MEFPFYIHSANIPDGSLYFDKDSDHVQNLSSLCVYVCV